MEGTLGDSSVSGFKGPPDTQCPESVNLRAELQNLDAEVSRVQALLKSLVDKRAHIKRRLNNLASPMLRLPPEISSKIFTFHLRRLQVGNRDLAADSPFISSSPFLLGKICSSWRELVWSLPSLWSSVSMDFRKNLPASYATLLDEYLSRSGSRPLSIRIRGSAVREVDIAATLDIMESIARFSERWCHIIFDLSPSGYEALRHVQGRVPILRDMVLCFQDPTPDFEPFEMFSIAPQLRVVNSIGFRPGTLTVPRAQLMTFYTNTCNAEYCLQLLRESPQLINAEFVLVNARSAGPLSHVTAPCLQSLTLRFASSRVGVSSFLDNLSIPAAHQLVFAVPEPCMVPFSCMSLASLIARSRCVLQCLSLSA